MKQLLILFAAVSLIACDKEDPILSQAEQEIENAKLVGVWRRVGSPDKREYGYVFTEDFKVSCIGIRNNDSYTIPQRGIMEVVMPRERILYRFESEYLFITDWVYRGDISAVYERREVKYEREE